MERDLLIGQIDRILAKQLREPFAKRDRSVFWLYYRQGLTSKAIASLPGIGLTSKGVEAMIHRLSKAVRNEIDGNKLFRSPEEGISSSGTLSREKGR
jgi:RNA polymerase sigma-70 factor (ECF subfamily)